MGEEEFFIGYQTHPLSNNVRDALNCLKERKDILASRFSAKEMNDIGLCYWYGHTVPLNYDEAFKWYQRAAENKDNSAEFNLYICYSQGTGGKKDMAEALIWLRKSARHNDARAQYTLGEMYYIGGKLRRNSYHSRCWLKKAVISAVTQKNSVILNQLGVRSYYGELGAKKDIKRATYYFEIAAKLQFPLSILWLIMIYKDNEERKNYWKEALEKCPYISSETNVASENKNSNERRV